MSQVVSFAEESCWDGERFRSIRREIVFVVLGFSTRLPRPVRREFTADFGLWYDSDDEWLLEILQQEAPDIPWGRYVYFKKIDHSAIIVHDPEDNEVLACIVPRGRTRRRLSREITGANVVPIDQGRVFRAARLAREEERARRRSERDNPTRD
jgi:hypothetical protein